MSFERAHRLLSRREANDKPRTAGLPASRHDGKANAFLLRHEKECSQYDRATRTERYRFARGLVARIADTRDLWIAVRHLIENGASAAGPNGQRLRRLIREDEKYVWGELRRLRKRTLDGAYTPDRARQTWVQKSSGKGKRPIEILNWQDQVVQRGIVQIIQPLIDTHLDDRCLGYRPGRDRTEALARAELLTQTESRYVWIAADLKNAFTNIPHAPLLNTLNGWFGNRRLTRLVEESFPPTVVREAWHRGERSQRCS